MSLLNLQSQRAAHQHVCTHRAEPAICSSQAWYCRHSKGVLHGDIKPANFCTGHPALQEADKVSCCSPAMHFRDAYTACSGPCCLGIMRNGVQQTPASCVAAQGATAPVLPWSIRMACVL